MLSELTGLPLDGLEERLIRALFLSGRRDLSSAILDDGRIEAALDIMDRLPREWAVELCREIDAIRPAGRGVE